MTSTESDEPTRKQQLRALAIACWLTAAMSVNAAVGLSGIKTTWPTAYVSGALMVGMLWVLKWAWRRQ